jgi:hypothetical protein
VAKTLLLSQISYIGTLITPSRDQLKTMTNDIKKFVCGSLNVSNENFTAELPAGGIGFPDLAEFICALQCGWLKKCIGSTVDNWRWDLNVSTNFNPTIFSQFDNWSEVNQLALNLSVSYETFKVCFLLINDNFKHSELYGNPLLQTRDNLRWDTSLIPLPNDNDMHKRKKNVNF